tara:strand:+ start:1367 stop:1750 length:384 start_codon:yes stop_codon:yes gene_type:complete
MKKSELKMMIREIVREEVRLGLKELLVDSKKSKRTEKKVEVPLTEKNVQIKKKHYVKNSVINDVLNETAVEGEWKKLQGDGPNVITEGTEPTLVSDNDPMSQLLNKDYRKVLESATHKSNQKHGVNN